jgi:hypothetical protein
MSKILVRKQETQPPSMMMGGGSGGSFGNIMYNLPAWVTPEEAVYGRFSEPDKEGNVRQISPGALPTDGTATPQMAQSGEKWARGLGRAGMVAGAGLGGLSALYNLTSSGEPLDLGGAANIGTAAYTGGRTAQPYSTTLGARIGVRRGRGMGTPENNTTAMMPLNNTADPRQRRDEPIDVDFTEREHDEQRMLAEPAVTPIDAAMGDIRNRTVYDDIQRRYGRPTTVYDDILQRYGQ